MMLWQAFGAANASLWPAPKCGPRANWPSGHRGTQSEFNFEFIGGHNNPPKKVTAKEQQQQMLCQKEKQLTMQL